MKVGDIIDGRRVTRIYNLCGCVAVDTEPVESKKDPVEIKEPKESKETPKRRSRKKKE